MNDRKSIEELLSDKDYDLLQYAGKLRKNGFTSTLSVCYLAEQDLHSPLHVHCTRVSSAMDILLFQIAKAGCLGGKYIYSMLFTDWEQMQRKRRIPYGML